MNRGERRALWHYRLRGYRILGTNVRAGRNELDLIVRRGRDLTFVEVKQRRGSGFGGAVVMLARAGDGRAAAERIAAAYGTQVGRQATILSPLAVEKAASSAKTDT